MALSRWLPRLIIALALIHLAYGLFVEHPGVLGDMARDGLWASADSDNREYFLWFMIGGLALLALGHTAHRAVAATGRIPAFIGGHLLAIGLTIAVFSPNGGGWLVILLGALTLLTARRQAVNTSVNTRNEGRAPNHVLTD